MSSELARRGWGLAVVDEQSPVETTSPAPGALQGTGDVVIELDQVWKKYRLRSVHPPDLRSALLHLPRYLKERKSVEFWALKDVSLQVRRGECVGVIGANGSGKSTLLGLVAGVLQPSRGRVTVRGRVAPLLELGLGFHPELTGRENVLLNGLLMGLTRQQVRERFRDIVAFAEIEDFIDQPMRTYSTGMFMRLAFAVAVHVEADTLLLDEVLAVGDERFKEKCLGRLQAEIRSGKTALFVSHSMEAVRRFCGRAMLLRRGEKLAEGHPDKVSDFYLRG